MSNRDSGSERIEVSNCVFFAFKNEDMHSRGFNHRGLTKCL